MKVSESMNGVVMSGRLTTPMDIFDAMSWSQETVAEQVPEENQAVVCYVNESDRFFDEYINWEKCLKENNGIYMDDVCNGKDVLPLEWMLGWCAKDNNSYLVAREMMYNRYSSLNFEERRKYRRGLIEFYKIMCESHGVSVDVGYINLVEEGVISEISYSF